MVASIMAKYHVERANTMLSLIDRFVDNDGVWKYGIVKNQKILAMATIVIWILMNLIDWYDKYWILLQ